MEFRQDIGAGFLRGPDQKVLLFECLLLWVHVFEILLWRGGVYCSLFAS